MGEVLAGLGQAPLSRTVCVLPSSFPLSPLHLQTAAAGGTCVLGPTLRPLAPSTPMPLTWSRWRAPTGGGTRRTRCCRCVLQAVCWLGVCWLVGCVGLSWCLGVCWCLGEWVSRASAGLCYGALVVGRHDAGAGSSLCLGCQFPSACLPAVCVAGPCCPASQVLARVQASAAADTSPPPSTSPFCPRHPPPSASTALPGRAPSSWLPTPTSRQKQQGATTASWGRSWTCSASRRRRVGVGLCFGGERGVGCFFGGTFSAPRARLVECCLYGGPGAAACCWMHERRGCVVSLVWIHGCGCCWFRPRSFLCLCVSETVMRVAFCKLRGSCKGCLQHELVP